MIDWKTKSYIRSSNAINARNTKIIWKKPNLNIDEINSCLRAGDCAALDALLIITVSEPSLSTLPKKIWKFFITPKSAMPIGPENTAIHLLITRPEIKINSWNELVEKILLKLNADFFIVLINESL